MHGVQAAIHDIFTEKADKFLVQLDGHQDRVGPHALQNLLCDGADTGAVLDDHAGAIPVHLAEQIVDQKAGTGDERAQHGREAEEIAGKKDAPG